jgi:hypothetical protein
METKIDYKGIDLRCEFEIYPISEQTEHEPESGGQMYDLFIYVQETEVSDLFDENQIIDIKERIYESIESEL